MERTTSTPELLVSFARERGAPPLRTQLELQLRDAIGAGRLAAGVKLPSSRALAAELGVSRGVVVDAYAQLAAEGYLDVRRGAAPSVATLPERSRRRAAAPPARARRADAPNAAIAPRLDLRPGTPDLALFPRRAWAAAQRRALREIADADLGYPDPAGHPRLRAALAEYLGRVRGVDADPERIVVCGGVAQVLSLTALVLRAKGATRLAVGDPAHRASRGQLEHHGLDVVPIAVDDDGIDVDAVVAAAPDAVLLSPAHHFPGGAVLSAPRRAALANWARATGALIVEDDYDAEYRYDRAPLGAVQGLAPEHTIHAHSVSKTLAPGLRLGWAVLPRPLVEPLKREKLWADMGVPVLEQLTLASFLEHGELDRHLRATRPIYRRRRDALLQALPELRASGAAAGLHVLVWLPPGSDEAAIQAVAARRGVAVDTLGPHATDAPPALLLGYARLAEPGLTEAARRLREAIAEAARLR